MANWRYVDFSVKEAQRLGDLASIAADLETTEGICRIFIGKRQQFEKLEWPEGFILFEALCTAAIIRYGRSFVSGIRERVSDKLIKELPSEHRESHAFFMDLRNKWVAHSVNPFDSTEVVAYLTPEERGPKSVSSVSARPNRISSLSIDDMLRLQALAKSVHERVQSLIRDEEQRVLHYARSLSIDQFYSEDTPPPRLPKNEDAGKSREKW